MLNNLSKKQRLILTLPLLLAIGLFVPSNAVPSVRAAGFTGTGLVCITASTTATNCSNSAPTVGPLSAGSTFSVGVFINNSQAMGGFDIYVRSDPTFLTPTSAALGPLIVTPSLTSICINGSPTTGSCTVGTANGNGVVEVTTIESSGTNECGGISPCSGMAFTISYTVVGVPSTGSTSLSYPTAAGCSTSSVSSPPNTCVLVADSIGTTLPENIQGAAVSINVPTAVVCVTYPATMTPCSPGAVMIGPVTRGQTFTVGVRVQNSQPYNGYKIYVAADPNFLRPIFGDVALGPGIANPAPPDICVNDQAQNGTCTGFEANGNGVVEVSTFDTSGLNECATGVPCSGLLFTITYVVIHKAPNSLVHVGPVGQGCLGFSSNPAGTSDCVQVASAPDGATLTEAISDGIATQSPPFNDAARAVMSCIPNPIGVDNPAGSSCTVTINDIASTGASDPIGEVGFTTDNPSGNFSPTASCTLSTINSTASNCIVTYTPNAAGTHNLGCIYPGDAAHTGANCPSLGLVASKATVSISTGVIVDASGLPVNATLGVPLGLAVHDVVAMVGGFPVTGVTGSVTYTLYPNGACTAGTGTVVSTVPVGSSDNVMASASVTPTTTGSFSFGATYSGDGNNNAVASACEPFNIVPTVSFTAGKLHWTHHLSLSKSGNMQSWTAIVTNPLTSIAKVVIRIVGTSTANPALSFDIVCGSTCVTTAAGGVNFTPGLTPVTVAAGASSFSFSFNQAIPSGFTAGTKIAFTATVYWTTGTLYTASGQKTGSFAIVA